MENCPLCEQQFNMLKNINNPRKQPIFINSMLYKRGVDTDLNEGLYEHLLFAEFADPTEFKNAFVKAGVLLDMSTREKMIDNAKLLTEFSLSGQDVNGTLRNGNGEQVFFNVKDILKNVDITQEEIKNSPLKFTKNLTTVI